jgi:hypothetical protein
MDCESEELCRDVEDDTVQRRRSGQGCHAQLSRAKLEDRGMRECIVARVREEYESDADLHEKARMLCLVNRRL